ncbi:uracil-DNA glycosylase [Pseudochelatococcus contaminans]|uniref:Type-5 uracil-DNA glycosylase n=1 Tax=Pseudochelatococcus contaminans TaxID=1538103 RepID=A0A7W6EF37_9HYPH|nr:uracil-DNA glycosylase [Pseudochelatococcus contaminans]MBB3808102.1 uracil-DNA glycosylase family 4 [Pseudochelatococcus contaminans]
MTLREAPATGPDANCQFCPRLAEFRHEWQAREPGWFNAPVPSFGPLNARLLIVGLAPGLRGANRTGRPFTGDYAGDLLYETLLTFGLARGVYAASPDDGLELVGSRITNGVRCVPPENKPTGAEIVACRPFLTGAMAEMPNLRAILALGRIAHDTTVRALGLTPSRVTFRHGGHHDISNIRLYDSYHCSRYNTSTRVLTPDMFRAVFSDICTYLEGSERGPADRPN